MSPVRSIPMRSLVRVIAVAIVTTGQPLLAQVKAVPFTETVHGQKVDDEYRWMEDPANAAELEAWVTADSRKTRALLDAVPERAGFVDALKTVSGSYTRRRGYDRAGATEVWLVATPADRTPRLMVRTAGGAERVLLDPNKGAGESSSAIGSVSLSPDGALAAVQVSSGGAEMGAIQILDVASGRQVGKPFDRIWGEFPLRWLGGDTVVYTQMAEPAPGVDPMLNMRAFVRDIAGTATPIVVMGPDAPAGQRPSDFPVIVPIPGSDWVLGLGAGARADAKGWLARKTQLARGAPQWRPLFDLDARVGAAVVGQDGLYVLTSRTNGNGTVQRRLFGPDGPGAPETIMEGSDALVLFSVVATADGVYVAGRADGALRVLYRGIGAKDFGPVALPFDGDSFSIEATADGRALRVPLTGWKEPTRQLLIEGGRVTDVGLASEGWPGAQSISVVNLEAKSRDGTLVPLVVMTPGGTKPAAGWPTVVFGYGSYGIATTSPFYDRYGMAWLSKGGAIARCGTRGGGERGRAWHEAGRSANKPNAHDDIIACAETLKAERITTAKGAVLVGGSAGGLLVLPVAIRRPELFAGLIASVAVTNPTRLAAAPNGANQFDELGNPHTADGYAALAKSDGYLMLSSARDLPDTMFVVGLNDKRVALWQTVKSAARAQAKFGKTRSILIRSDKDAGHGVGTAEDTAQAERADEFAFAWTRATGRP